MKLTLEQLQARRIEIADQLRGSHRLEEQIDILEALITLDAAIRERRLEM